MKDFTAKQQVLNWFRFVTRRHYHCIRRRLDLFYERENFVSSFVRVPSATKLNLCCGEQKIPGYVGIDTYHGADVVLDLSVDNIPYPDGSIDAVVCMSGINYFTRERACSIVREVHRVLKSGGVARFGSQDLYMLATKYINKEAAFFFQKKKDGGDRFEGPTIGDKFVAWFYGYETSGGKCRYFYDYESLAILFNDASFSSVQKRAFCDSRLQPIELIDNRPELSFYLEAVK